MPTSSRTKALSLGRGWPAGPGVGTRHRTSQKALFRDQSADWSWESPVISPRKCRDGNLPPAFGAPSVTPVGDDAHIVPRSVSLRTSPSGHPSGVSGAIRHTSRKTAPALTPTSDGTSIPPAFPKIFPLFSQPSGCAAFPTFQKIAPILHQKSSNFPHILYKTQKRTPGKAEGSI